MNEFRAAKNTIRQAVAAAPRATVESILEAAREGRVPWSHGDTCLCGWLTGSGAWWGRGLRTDPYWEEVSQAYRHLGQGDSGEYSQLFDDRRQRLLVPICRADLRRRDRAAVKALVDSACQLEVLV